MLSSDKQRQDPPLRSAADQRVLDLQVGNRVDGVCAADGVGPHLGQSNGADIPGLHEIRNRADGLFDRLLRIETTWAVDVDMIDAEAPEGVAEEVLHGRRLRIDTDPTAVRPAQGPKLDERAPPCHVDRATLGR